MEINFSYINSPLDESCIGDRWSEPICRVKHSMKIKLPYIYKISIRLITCPVKWVMNHIPLDLKQLVMYDMLNPFIFFLVLYKATGHDLVHIII